MDVIAGADQGRGRRRLIVTTAAVFAAMLTTGLVFHYLSENLDSGIPGWRILSGLGSLFYADGEANLWAWSSSLLLVSIGVTLVVVGFAVRHEDGQGAVYFILAALTLGMSADEVTQFHEKLARLDLGTGFTFAWLSVGVPLAVLIGLIVLRISRQIDRQLRRRLSVAGFVYLLGAVGFEVIGGLAVGGRVDEAAQASLVYHVLLALEEGLEVTGALLALAAALSALTVERTTAGILVRTSFGRPSTVKVLRASSPGE